MLRNHISYQQQAGAGAGQQAGAGGGQHGFGQHTGLGQQGRGHGSQQGFLSQQQLVKAIAVAAIATKDPSFAMFFI